MTSARRQDDDICRLEAQLAAWLSAETAPPRCRARPHRLLDARVEVKIVVHAVAPAIETVSLEQFLEDRRGIECRCEPDRPAIVDQRPGRMIGHRANRNV
jgi:hypothetical protein